MSLRQLRRNGYHWDNQEDPTILRRRDKSIAQHSLHDDEDEAEAAAEDTVEVFLSITDMADDAGQDEGGQTSDG